METTNRGNAAMNALTAKFIGTVIGSAIFFGVGLALAHAADGFTAFF
jgi:hypothetical protein